MWAFEAADNHIFFKQNREGAYHPLSPWANSVMSGEGEPLRKCSSSMSGKLNERVYVQWRIETEEQGNRPRNGKFFSPVEPDLGRGTLQFFSDRNDKVEGGNGKSTVAFPAELDLFQPLK